MLYGKFAASLPEADPLWRKTKLHIHPLRILVQRDDIFSKDIISSDAKIISKSIPHSTPKAGKR